MNPRGFPHESTPSLSSLVGEVRSGTTVSCSNVAARKREPRAVVCMGVTLSEVKNEANCCDSDRQR